ncbi:MAG: porin family protein, partial [Mesorhizobium sp.]
RRRRRGLQLPGGPLRSWRRGRHCLVGHRRFPWASFVQHVQLRSGPCETEVNWLATIRGRAGYAFDNILPYVTGGVAIGGVDARIQNAPTLQDGEETQIGWTVGAGIEYGITQQWTAKVEYLYTDLGDWRYDSDGSDFSATAKFSTVKFGVNYRF